MPSTSPARTDKPEPAWDIARLFPPQGHWTEGAYLSFTESLNQLVELADGCVEVLEMPTKSHQKIVHSLLNLVLAFLGKDALGDAVAAPYRIHLRTATYREPDVVVYLREHLDRFGERFGEVPDLVFEVVSDDPTSQRRDYDDKRRDYALAGISEYWIVDPRQNKIVVLHLQGDDYGSSSEFGAGQVAQSAVLGGFTVDVTSLFSAAREGSSDIV